MAERKWDVDILDLQDAQINIEAGKSRDTGTNLIRLKYNTDRMVYKFVDEKRCFTWIPFLINTFV